MAIIQRKDFVETYQGIELDLRNANTIAQLKAADLEDNDIQALKQKDGHRLAVVNGQIREISNAVRDNKINAEEAYLYLEAKDSNGTWNSVNPDAINNPNREILARRVAALSRVFSGQSSTRSVGNRSTLSPQTTVPELSGLSFDDANDFFDRHPELRYDRPLAKSLYQLKPAEARTLFEDNSIKQPMDLLTKQIEIGSNWESVLTHLRHPNDLRLIAYRNKWQSRQRDMLRFIQPGEWYLGTSHHNPANRMITRQSVQHEEEGIELLKFNITHVRNYIGIQNRSRQAGVVATDSPRSYANQYHAGHANNKDYPFLIWRVRFLGDISHAEQRAYINNIRTWTMLFSKVTKFPKDYNGNDNLLTYSMPRVIEFADNVLSALQGSQSALKKLHQKSAQVYCSESGMHLALNLGLNVPLNQSTIWDVFGGDAWDTVQSIISAEKRFWKNGAYQDYYSKGHDGYVTNSEQYRKVDLELAPDWLEPLKNKLSGRNLVGDGLAFRPWNTAGMIEHFIKTAVPRKGRETWDVANTQAELLSWLKPSIFHSLGFSQANPPPPDLVRLFDTLITKIRMNYSSYQEFRQAIAVELALANQIVAPKSLGEGAFVPPHMVMSIKGDDDEMVALEPVGQCFHESIMERNSM